MTQRTMTAFLLICAATALTGCAKPMQLLPPRPANINHFVVFKLHDPAEADELIHDCDTLLGTIPGVMSYFAGRHHDVGREHIYSDYDVGFFVGFNSDEDYEVYVKHPNHVQVVEKWRPRLRDMRVYDVFDDGTR
jgi:hypothetical protein